jgi:hypothetical protein
MMVLFVPSPLTPLPEVRLYAIGAGSPGEGNLVKTDYMQDIKKTFARNLRQESTPEEKKV